MSTSHRSFVLDHRTLLQDHDFSFLAESPLVLSSQYFNLFFDQIIDDALGWEVGQEVRADSAYEASSQLLNAFILDMPPTTRDERLDIAASLFAGMGLGTLEFDISHDSGIAIGHHLHYGMAWRKRHGTERNRAYPADAVAAGFIAAAVEAAFGMPLGSIFCEEKRCVATQTSDYCEFEVVDSGQTGDVFGVTRADLMEVLPATIKSQNEGRISDLVTELREFVLAVTGDKRGMIDKFGVHLTHQLGNYHNHCRNRMLGILSEEKPAALEVAQELLRECGQKEAFFTFGGILTSPEWDALVASFRGQPQVIVEGCVAMARAFGLGHWCVEAHDDDRLVLTSPGTCESAYRKLAYPEGDAPSCYAFQGAAMAVMDLAHKVDWQDDHTVSMAEYQGLRSAMHWKTSETHCLAAGHDVCRVVVERC